VAEARSPARAAQVIALVGALGAAPPALRAGEPADPLVAPAAPVRATTGALLLTPPGESPASHVFASLGFQIAAAQRQGWGTVTSTRGALAVGGEWAPRAVTGLAVGGQVSLLELHLDQVDVPPAIDEAAARADLGALRLHVRFVLGDSAGPRRFMPGQEGLRTQLLVYLRGTFPTATSVLSRARHPRISLRDSLGDAVNAMRWGGLELGAALGLVARRWISAWLAYTPLWAGWLPEGRDHAFFQALHLATSFRLPPRLPGGSALELLLEVGGAFRLPGGEVTGAAYLGVTPGVRWCLPRWDLTLAGRFGVGSWAELGDRGGVTLEASRRW
jgi:hypothetical protein